MLILWLVLCVLIVLIICAICKMHREHDIIDTFDGSPGTQQEATNNVGDSDHPIDIFYINLDRRTDRRSWMDSHLTDAGVTAHRWPACDGTKANTQEMIEHGLLTPRAVADIHTPVEQKVFGVTMTVGAAGCAQSHVSLWQHVARQPSDRLTVILEDDVRVEWSRLQPFLRDVPDDWDILYLGSGQYTTTDEKLSSSAKYAGVSHAYGLFGYIIRPRSVDKLLSVLPLDSQIDGALQSLPLNKYIAVPAVVEPRRDLHTDIQILD